MLIRFKQSIAGAGWCRNPGEVADIEEAEAFRLIKAGFAQPEPEPQPEPVEIAAVPDSELQTATVKTTRAAKPKAS